MNISNTLIRILYALVCMLAFSAYTTSTMAGGFTPTNLLFGILGGSAFALILTGADYLLKRCDWALLSQVILGVALGVLVGQALVLVIGNMIDLGSWNASSDTLKFVYTIAYLLGVYLGLATVSRLNILGAAPSYQPEVSKDLKKDIVMDASVLTDSRIIDLATSGLLDNHLIFPRFILKELFAMVESADEHSKTKARRCLDVFKKLENISGLNIRYSDVDYPELKDTMSKMLKLARTMNANVMTVDLSRIQQSAIEDIKIININTLSNALKPLTQAGEYINIKIQRYGKEPRQGVGYLDDGTMVVVNGGAEYIGETIKSQVLSVKHTSSGRMIFCNSTDETLLSEQESARNVASLEENHPSQFFAR